MHKANLPDLSQRLSQLADALGGRSPSPSGLLVWLDTLAECAMDDVLGVLTDWPKSNSKMPLPADVLRLSRERTSFRLESQSAQNAKTARAPAPQFVGDKNSPQYQAFCRWVAKHRPTPPPRAWAWKLKAREERGENLLPVQMDAWRVSLRYEIAEPTADLDPVAVREARIEREAMQAEGGYQSPVTSRVTKTVNGNHLEAL